MFRNSSTRIFTFLLLASLSPIGVLGGVRAQTVAVSGPVRTTALSDSARAFTHFESTHVHPLRVSPSGALLACVHTIDGRISIFDVATDPSTPVLVEEIRVGLEPVSLTFRTETEIWVANQLSDSVSVVDLTLGRVIDTLRVVDEPSDVAFALDRAFVAAAATDEVHVFDAITRAELSTLPIPAKDPRALGVTPDGQGVLVLSRRSGNGTTILPEGIAPPPPLPVNPALPLAPRVGLIVRADDPAYQANFPYSLADEDLFEIDASTLSVTAKSKHVGTTNFDLVVRPSGEILVASTDAKNLVRFEPELRGNFLESRITRITSANPNDTVDLNATIDPTIQPNLVGRSTALTEPTGLALSSDGSQLWIAAQATDRVARFDLASNTIVARVPLGRLGGGRSTLSMRGPRAIDVHPAGDFVYVYNRLADSISTIGTALNRVVAETPIGSFDPMPLTERLGRKFLFDARLSGAGLVSCASCHVDADTDGLAWDLGDPSGEMIRIPSDAQQGGQPGVPPILFPDLHPMKGPLVTRPLRGLDGRLLWRGEHAEVAELNERFASLLGGAELNVRQLELFTRWMTRTKFAPNPNRELDDTLADPPAGPSQARGLQFFSTTGIGAGAFCIECHVPPSGANGFVRNFPIGSNQPMRVAPLRDYYRKEGFEAQATGPVKSGFGRFHNGELGELSELGVAVAGGGANSEDVDAYLMAFDTGTAPIVGRQLTLNATTLGTPEFSFELQRLESQALAGKCDLIVHGWLAGEERGFLYDPATGLYDQDRAVDQPVPGGGIEAVVQAGFGPFVFVGVAPGEGRRFGIDRDQDGVLDGDE